MTRLVWNEPGKRFFETGVSRGVLYVDGIGVPWNGLISIDEQPTGGEPKPYYLDGYKYLNLASAEEYEAALTAYNSPPEFNACDGVGSIQNGLFVTQQRRKTFSFSYRTRIGNDVDRQDHGYKIHIVYNALAAPSPKSNNTMGEDVEPIQLSWDITTLAPKLTGLRPTAHLVIDSRYTPAGLMAHVEDILYGTEGDSATLPPAQDLIDLFMTEGPLLYRNIFVNPSVEVDTTAWSTLGGRTVTRIEDLSSPVGGAYARISSSASDGRSAVWGPAGLLEEGKRYGVRCRARGELAIAYPARIQVFSADNSFGTAGTVFESYDSLALDTVLFTELTAIFTVPEGVTDLRACLQVGSTANGAGYVDVDAVLIVELPDGVDEVPEYFDGDTVDNNGYFYSWEGTAHSSASLVNSWH